MFRRLSSPPTGRTSQTRPSPKGSPLPLRLAPRSRPSPSPCRGHRARRANGPSSSRLRTASERPRPARRLLQAVSERAKSAGVACDAVHVKGQYPAEGISARQRAEPATSS